MKYYFCETEARNRIPYGINHNRGLDIRIEEIEVREE